MSQLEDTVEFIKKIKRKYKKKDKISPRMMDLAQNHLDKKFEAINKKFSAETKHLAKRLKKPAVPFFN